MVFFAIGNRPIDYIYVLGHWKLHKFIGAGRTQLETGWHKKSRGGGLSESVKRNYIVLHNRIYEPSLIVHDPLRGTCFENISILNDKGSSEIWRIVKVSGVTTTMYWFLVPFFILTPNWLDTLDSLLKKQKMRCLKPR